jgi:hypothetical protein
MEAERIGEAVVDVEQHTHLDCILYGLIGHAGGADWFKIRRPDIGRGERELLEETEGGTQLRVDRGSAPIGQDGLDQVVLLFALQGQRRDRAVSARSEYALVQARRERGKQLPLTDAPRRGPAHHGLGPVAHGAAEKLRSIEQRLHDVGHAPHAHHADEQELQALRQPVTVLDGVQAH